MSRAAGDVRAVIVDTETPWAVAALFEWFRAQLQPYLDTGERVIYYAPYVAVALLVLFVALYTLRVVLRRARIRHYSR